MRAQTNEKLPVPTSLLPVVDRWETTGIPVHKHRLHDLMTELHDEDMCGAQARDIARLRALLGACGATPEGHGLDVTYRISATSLALVAEPNLDALVAYPEVVAMDAPHRVVDVSADPWQVLAELANDDAMAAAAADANIVHLTWRSLGTTSRPAVDTALRAAFFSDEEKQTSLSADMAALYRDAARYVRLVRMSNGDLSPVKHEVSSRTNVAVAEAVDLASEYDVDVTASLGGGRLLVTGSEANLDAYAGALTLVREPAAA